MNQVQHFRWTLSLSLSQVFYMKPHYILFIHLICNDVLQLTTATCLLIVSYVFYRINASVCCLLITLVILATLNTPFNLAVMAVECYVAVCLPLKHAKLCTLKHTHIAIVLMWALSAASVLPDVIFSLATEPLQFFFTRIFCERNNLFRHPLQVQKRDHLYIVYMAVVWLVLLYTYVRIFMAARGVKASHSGGGEMRKARNTILLHSFQLLLCMLTFVADKISRALIQHFPRNTVNLLFFIFVLTQILPRGLSPLVYGLRDKTLRQYLKNYLLWGWNKAI